MGAREGALEGLAVSPPGLRPAPARPAADFWRGRRVLLTGHTGFKGAWLALWLARMGARVTGFALPPETVPALFSAAAIADLVDSRFGDVRDADAVRALVREVQPEIVLHLAAQALVRESYRAPLETFATNVMGTAHVLDALRGVEAVKVALVVTTDKVYANREWLYPYREADPLGGHDPYSASKAACEMAVESWRLAFLAEQGVAVASARAGNVIGGGDWSADRLIPDAVRAWGAGEILDVRRPRAVRPWQHVLEPLAGYLVAVEHLWRDPALAGAYNFGPDSADMAAVRSVITLARAGYGKGETRFAADETGPHEAGLLAIETVKARTLLGAVPRWPLEEAVGRTMAWYAAFDGGADARALCAADIAAFEAAP